MVSLKDYAKESGVTYEAVRQQVKRYRTDLEGHIHQQGRTQYLDDDGVAILDSHRAQRPITVYEAGYDRQLREKEQEIAELEEENKLLLKKVADQGARIGELADWKAENAVAIAEANQTKLMLDSARADLDQVKQEAAEQKAELKRAEQETDQLRQENAAMAAELAKISGMGPLKRLFYKPQKGK